MFFFWYLYTEVPWWRSRYSNATGTYKTIASKAHSELHCYQIQCKYCTFLSVKSWTNYVRFGCSHHFYSAGIVLKKQSVDDETCCSGNWQFSCEECEAWDWHFSWRMLLLSSDVETGPLQQHLSDPDHTITSVPSGTNILSVTQKIWVKISILF